MKTLLSQLAYSLKEENTDENRHKWAEHILKNQIPILDLVDLIKYDKPVSMRFIWLIGHLCDIKPEVVTPAIPYFFAVKKEVKFSNYDRSLAKMFSLCGIPSEIEADVVNSLFNWILDPAILVSTKNYSLDALLKFSENYPEIKNELRIVIEDQLSKNSVSFEKHAKRILEKL